MSRQFTGRHMAMILIAFFGVVIAVNVAMARLASSTFGGVVVENTYVASQEFNRWLDEAKHENALGWSATVRRAANDTISVHLTGGPADTMLSAEARHPLGQAPDRSLTFTSQGNGSFVSQQPLPPGRWIVRFTARAGKAIWRTEEDIQ